MTETAGKGFINFLNVESLYYNNGSSGNIFVIMGNFSLSIKDESIFDIMSNGFSMKILK